MPRITQEHEAALLQDGFALAPAFLTEPELRAARSNLLRYFPTYEELMAAPERYAALLEDAEHQQIEFPFAGHALNHMATHPEIIAFVERLLGTPRVMLSQAAIWAKYAGTGSFEQQIHLDYEGNTLVYPRDDGKFRQVNLILYYSDVTADMGPTCVVPQSFTRGQSLWPPFRPRKEHPALYKLERPMVTDAGGLLIFSMQTFHRASEMRADTGARFSQHLVYRATDCPWNGYHHWSRFGEKPELAEFLQATTPRQREVIGFPAPGDPYWNAETLAGVAARYPRMDMTPYQR